MGISHIQFLILYHLKIYMEYYKITADETLRETVRHGNKDAARESCILIIRQTVISI